MTIGIYRLDFNGTNKVYIGQSVNLETRLTRHIIRVNNGTASAKLTEAFKEFGKPSLTVLAECEESELDTFEYETIDIYDSVNNGFNTVFNMVKTSLYGQNNPNSKYTDSQIIEAFKLLTTTTKSAKTISAICKISASMVGHISCGESHKWLQDMYPEEYAHLLSLKGKKLNRHKGQ